MEQVANKNHKRFKLRIDPNRWKEQYKHYSKTALLFITSDCNLNCAYCFNNKSMARRNVMDLGHIKKIVENNPQIEKYDLQGGEPLIHKDINKFITYLESQNKTVGVYTNGYLLRNLDKKHKNIKLGISFQSLEAEDKSFKPLKDITENINEYSKFYKVKLVFLMTQYNKNQLTEVIKYVETNLPNIETLTIGLIRDEEDYWNDNQEYIIPFNEYYTIIQKLIDTYEGRLNLDIFTKGVLYTDNLPKQSENQLCRFKNIYNDYYIPCLYQIAQDKRISISKDLQIPFPETKVCHRTGLKNCLADKIYLKKLND